MGDSSNGKFWRYSLYRDSIFSPGIGITLAMGVLGGGYEYCESILMYGVCLRLVSNEFIVSIDLLSSVDGPFLSVNDQLCSCLQCACPL